MRCFVAGAAAVLAFLVAWLGSMQLLERHDNTANLKVLADLDSLPPVPLGGPISPWTRAATSGDPPPFVTPQSWPPQSLSAQPPSNPFPCADLSNRDACNEEPRLCTWDGKCKGKGANKAYVMAHMVNTPKAIRWALNQGANAIEFDVNFDRGHMHTRHGTPCDCSTLIGTLNAGNVCYLESGFDACTASASLDEIISTIIEHKHRIAMAYFDSKVATLKEADYYRGGQSAGAAILRLFHRGFLGLLVVDCNDSTYRNYLSGIVHAIGESPFAKKILYTFGGTLQGLFPRDDVGATLRMEYYQLAKQTQYRILSAGISTAAPVGDSRYSTAMKIGSTMFQDGFFAVPPLIWTVDSEKSMMRFIDDGARILMTNVPSRARSAFNRANHHLAIPGEYVPEAATVNDSRR